jgi:hypothetical protein
METGCTACIEAHSSRKGHRKVVTKFAIKCLQQAEGMFGDHIKEVISTQKTWRQLRRELERTLSYQTIQAIRQKEFSFKIGEGIYGDTISLRFWHCEGGISIARKYYALCSCGEWEPEYTASTVIPLPKPICPIETCPVARPPFIISRAGVQPLSFAKSCRSHVCPNCRMFVKSRSHTRCKTCQRQIPLISTPLFLVKQSGPLSTEVMMQFHFVMQIVRSLPTELVMRVFEMSRL